MSGCSLPNIRGFIGFAYLRTLKFSPMHFSVGTASVFHTQASTGRMPSSGFSASKSSYSDTRKRPVKAAALALATSTSIIGRVDISFRAPRKARSSAPSMSILITSGENAASRISSIVTWPIITASRVPPFCVLPKPSSALDARPRAAIEKCAMPHVSDTAAHRRVIAALLFASLLVAAARERCKSENNQGSASIDRTRPSEPARPAAANENMPTFAPRSHTFVRAIG